MRKLVFSASLGAGSYIIALSVGGLCTWVSWQVHEGGQDIRELHFTIPLCARRKDLTAD